MRRPEYYLYGVLHRLFGPAGAEAVFRAGVQVLLASGPARDGAERNLRRVAAFSRGAEPSKEEMAAMIGELAGNYARYLCTMGQVQWDYRVYMDETDAKLLPTLRELLDRGKGAVLVAPHLGFLNILEGKLAHIGIPINFLLVSAEEYRLPPGVLDNLRMHNVGESAAAFLKALRNNETVLVNGDIDYFPEARTLPFFGAPFPAPHGAVRLAEEAGAPLLAVQAPLIDGRWRLLCDRPIPADSPLSREEREALLMRSMERMISAHPTQWFVFHDVWDLPAAAERARRQLERLKLIRRLWKVLGG